MEPIMLLIVTSPILIVVAICLCWHQPFFQNRAFRIALGAFLLLPAAFCAFGILASYELPGPEGLVWRLRYILLGTVMLSSSLYFFFKRPILSLNS